MPPLGMARLRNGSSEMHEGRLMREELDTTAILQCVTYSEEALSHYGKSLSFGVAWWIRECYGERCEEVSEHCPCCQKWAAFDALFGEKS